MKRKFCILLMLVTVLSLWSFAAKADGVSISVTRIMDGYIQQYGIITATENDNVLWEFTTPVSPITELESISDVYQNNDTAYIIAANTLYAFDIYSGAIKWTAENAGASNRAIFDQAGNIYISGYYGPNIAVFSPDGTELYRDNDNTYYWVYKLELDGNTLHIYYDSEEGGHKTIDMSQFLPKEITVNLNGKQILFDQPPIMAEGDRVIVPIRAIFEAMGYEVTWDQDTMTAVAISNDDNIQIQVGNKIIKYYLDGIKGEYTCDVLPQIISDRVLVPVRAVAESAGCNVSWDGEEQSVNIVSK